MIYGSGNTHTHTLTQNTESRKEEKSRGTTAKEN